MDQKTQDSMILLEHLPFAVDRGIASRARIGLIVLATDYTIEHEWRRIMGGLSGVASRVFEGACAEATSGRGGRSAFRAAR